MNSTMLPTEGNAHPAEGEKRRDRVLSRIERKKAYLCNLAGRTAVELARSGKSFTSDDVRDALKIPSHVRAHFLGPVFARLRRSGILRAVGMRPSRLAQCHGRSLPLWTLASAAAARQWLDRNPPLPDPPPPALFGPDDFDGAEDGKAVSA